MPTNYEKMPWDFSFLWSIDDLETVYPDNVPPEKIPLAGRTNSRASYWLPPNKRSHYKNKRSGKVYRWFKGKSTLMENKRKPFVGYSTASVFIQARQSNFLVFEGDCRDKNIADVECGWSQLTFKHHGSSGLSEAEFFGKYKDHLCAPSNGSWMPQVVPATYDPPTRGPRKYEGKPISSGGLCGRIAIIFALAAFSTEPERVEDVIVSCFGLGFWTPHLSPIGIGRYDERGVVVKIYLDPDTTITKNDLRLFERGRYGPIFVNDTVRSETAVSSVLTQQPNYVTPSYASSQSARNPGGGSYPPSTTTSSYTYGSNTTTSSYTYGSNTGNYGRTAQPYTTSGTQRVSGGPSISSYETTAIPRSSSTNSGIPYRPTTRGGAEGTEQSSEDIYDVSDED